ncbi:neurotrimin isoform X6 [Esox lucius]|uniref:neurotrimin isoform X6 n=1 Tax=Esox lucius TaxID=8010 RepID=UPI000661E82F|nr:neurotrimin isoform X6 [Esox lucius]
MGVCGYFAASWKCLVVLFFRLLFLVPAGLPVHSQGDSQTDSKVMDNITVKQGETVFLRCAQGDIVTHTAWLNRSSILYAGEDKWSVDPRVSLVTFNQEEFTIKIEDVDMTDEGPYICAVQTSSRPRTTSVHILVQVPPIIINLSKDIVVNEGSNVTLMCQASGKPEPSLTWKLLSPSDAPSVSEGRDVGVAPGQRGVLECEVDSMPEADFEWYRDDRRIFNDFDGIQIEDVGQLSKLTFLNVSEEDYGNYTCIAINKLGSSNTSFVLYEIIEPTSSTLLQDGSTSVLDLTSSVLEKTTSETFAIQAGPGAVQDGNSGSMGTHVHTYSCLLLAIILQFLLSF